jgi:hypothetical protein
MSALKKIAILRSKSHSSICLDSHSAVICINSEPMVNYCENYIHLTAVHMSNCYNMLRMLAFIRKYPDTA